MKKIIYIFKSLIKTVLVLLLLGPLVLLLFYWFDDAGACLDAGKVWDYEQKQCRDDCLVWQPEFGCIALTPEQVKLFAECRHKVGRCPADDVYADICLQNNKALNLDSGACLFTFLPTDCGKLSGHWKYPAVCNK